MTRNERELCLSAHADCADDPAAFAGPDAAALIYRVHADHGPRCLQWLATAAYLSADDADED